MSVEGFWIQANLVTNREFKAWDPAHTFRTGEENRPVTGITWNRARDYARYKRGKLPSEVQWEYAARGGVRSAYWWGREIGRNSAHCFTCDTGLDPRKATAVGRFKPNPFGLYDTAGNVQEWVYDCYHKNYEGAPTDGTVFEGGDCSVRVLRGGGFSSGPDKLRSAGRDKFRPDKGNDQTGIRVIRLR